MWLGAIFSGAVVVGKAGDATGRGMGTRMLGAFYGAFSPLAWAAMGVLVVSGIFKTQSHLTTGVTDLVNTDWGRLLLVKLALVATMIGLGAYATYHLAPQVQSKGSQASRSRASRGLTIASRTAAAIGLLILLIVTLL